jgi:hypothetical protein
MAITIQQALISLNSFPIPNDQIEKVTIDRGLTLTGNYTQTVGESEAFRLASADIYYWLANAPSIVEQEVGVNQAIAIKKQLLELAMAIYGEYDDPKFVGETYGLRESYNG